MKKNKGVTLNRFTFFLFLSKLFLIYAFFCDHDTFFEQPMVLNTIKKVFCTCAIFVGSIIRFFWHFFFFEMQQICYFSK